MGNSRHKRHLRVLRSLVKSGWKVEACYHRKTGFGGNIDGLGFQVFWPLNDIKSRRFKRSVYYAPPDLTGGGEATFILVRRLPVPASPCSAVRRINGWKDLSAFAVQERRAKEAKAKEGAAQ